MKKIKLLLAVIGISMGLYQYCSQAEESSPKSEQVFSSIEREQCQLFKNEKGKDRYERAVSVRKAIKKVNKGRLGSSANGGQQLVKTEIIDMLGRPEKEEVTGENRTVMSYDLKPTSELLKSADLIIILEDDKVVDVVIAKDG